MNLDWSDVMIYIYIIYMVRPIKKLTFYTLAILSKYAYLRSSSYFKAYLTLLYSYHVHMYVLAQVRVLA